MGAAGYLINNRGEYAPNIEPEIEPIFNSFENPYLFHKGLPEYYPTPLTQLNHLSGLLGVGNILVKDEGRRFGTSALKILGASFATHELLKSNPAVKGICTATDGNHGRALAWSAKQNGLSCVIFVPCHTAHSRIKYIADEGAQVIVSQGRYDDAVAEAKEYARLTGYALVQDTSWAGYLEIPAIITAGYYTQMHEISQQTRNLSIPRIDIVFVQAGVGSWPSSVVHFIRKKLNNQTVKIVCVEPYESDAIYESVKQNALAGTRKSQKTIMAGLNCGTPSILAFDILRQGVDAFVIIDDQYAIDAIKYLNAPLPGDPYIAAGESGSAGLAGLLAILNNDMLAPLKQFLEIKTKSNILLFNTENVTDPEYFNQLLNGNKKNHAPEF
ncbi:MAG: diaminopropionate ammonia-lyase [Bacteroidales bacterium]|nr:diaminopropionate ammonia-lyase [Bacteroidales bacterium]